MSLPYENSTSGQRALGDIQKILREFGCTKFATGEDFDTGEVFVQFEYEGRPIQVSASAKGYAAAWLKEHPYTHRTRASRSEHEAKALKIGSMAVYSILRDWIKGQMTAIAIGVMTFEGAFLAHFMLPSGRSFLEEARARDLLPALQSGGA